jgi:hypothetical protein
VFLLFLLCSLPKKQREATMGRLKEDALASATRFSMAMTLGDLMNQGLDVFCWCNRCGHNAVLAVRLLVGQMGAAQAVPEVGARLRCSGCASKDVATRPAWAAEDPAVDAVLEAPIEGPMGGPCAEEVLADQAA